MRAERAKDKQIEISAKIPQSHIALITNVWYPSPNHIRKGTDRMRYLDFIEKTMLGETGIQWDYYGQFPNATDSRSFIRSFFDSGRTELAQFFSSGAAKDFIKSYFSAGRKESALSLNINEPYELPDERAVHTVSGFFLGLAIENCMNGATPLSIVMEDSFPFSYLWFLTFLYHDYGYCVAEQDHIPPGMPTFAHISPCKNHPLRSADSTAIFQALKVLGIDISPFPFYRHRSQLYGKPNLIHALSKELKQYNISKTRIQFSNSSAISRYWYSQNTLVGYFNYCLNHRQRLDHGIIGGSLFYDRMIKNYIYAYVSSIEEQHKYPNLSDFKFRERHFSAEQLPIFSYIADCIMVHNVWKEKEETKSLYMYYRLNELSGGNYKQISFQANPLLYILSIADSLEPVKIYGKQYSNLQIESILRKLDIDYQPGSCKITFSFCDDSIPIDPLYQEALNLTDWTTIQCSKISDGYFTITL